MNLGNVSKKGKEGTPLPKGPREDTKRENQSGGEKGELSGEGEKKKVSEREY